MGNKEIESNTLIVKTCINYNDESISLTIPKEFATELDLGDSKVSITLVENYDGEKGLIL